MEATHWCVSEERLSSSKVVRFMSIQDQNDQRPIRILEYISSAEMLRFCDNLISNYPRGPHVAAAVHLHFIMRPRGPRASLSES